MSDSLVSLEGWLSPLLAALSAQERRALARKVGQNLRRTQAARIAAQSAPDGSDYAPRKAPPTRARAMPGKIRRTMFAKLRTAKHFKVQTTEEGVAVGFLGRAARIATVHQEGREDRVKPGGPTHRYSARTLLGFTDAEREQLRDSVLAHLTG